MPLMNPSDDLDFGQTIRGFAEGQRVFGRYTLHRVLGRGGMGIVWLAWDEKLERDIALKFMPEMVRLDAAAVDELKRETRKSLSLTHTNIVRIHDFVEDGQSAAIAMEYIDGATLSALRVQQPRRVFEVEELQSWVGQICDAFSPSPSIPDMSDGSPTKAADRIFFHTDDESHARFVTGRLKVMAQLLAEFGVTAMSEVVPATPNPTLQQPRPSPTPTSQELVVPPFVRRAVIEDSDGYTNVRQGASKSSSILARINNGEVFYTYPQQESWWRIRTASGVIGHIHNSRIRLQKQ